LVRALLSNYGAGAEMVRWPRPLPPPLLIATGTAMAAAAPIPPPISAIDRHPPDMNDLPPLDLDLVAGLAALSFPADFVFPGC